MCVSTAHVCVSALPWGYVITTGRPTMADSSGAFSIVANSMLVAAQRKEVGGASKEEELATEHERKCQCWQHTVRINL